MIRMFARTLMAALTIGLLTVSPQATAQTPTPVFLYGNEGLGIGSVPLGGPIATSTAYTHPAMCQGFTVGATPFVLTSVNLGLVIPNGPTPALDIALFDSVADVNQVQIPGNRIGSFSAVPTNNGGVFTLNAKILYNFAYSGSTILEPGKSYWVLVSYTPQDSSAPTFYWQFATGRGTDTPVAKNSSGFAYLGTLGQHDFGANWEDHGNGYQYPNSGLAFGIYGTDVPVVNPGGGGDVVTPPTLDCYALSKGFFKNKYPSGWPAAVVSDGGMDIGGRFYSVLELRVMLGSNTTGGNQIGQLSSQLVAVALSRALAYQTAVQNLGQEFVGWDGWAAGSDEARQAYDDAAALLAPIVGVDNCNRLTGNVQGVSSLIGALDGYIQTNHCGSTGGGSDDDCDRDDRDDRDGKGKGHDRDKGHGHDRDKGKDKGYDRDKGKDKGYDRDKGKDHDHDHKKVENKKRDPKKRHDCN
jgi:hypothetical protein